MSIFTLALIVQTVVITIIVIILKKVLDKQLIELAIKQLKYIDPQKGIDRITVITHKKLCQPYQSEVTHLAEKNFGPQIIKDYQTDRKIIGGIIIKINDKIYDHSIRDRLRRAKTEY